MNKYTLLNRVRDQIRQGNLESAINLLNQHQALLNNNLKNEVVQLSSRYNYLIKTNTRGEISSNDLEVSLNKITGQVLNLLDQIKLNNTSPKDEKVKISNAKWRTIVLIIILIGGLVLGFNYFWNNPKLVTISCHFIDESGNRINANEGTLRLYDSKSFQREVPVQHGIATFPKIPKSQLQHLQFQLLRSNCMSLLIADSVFVFQQEPIKLMLKDTCNQKVNETNSNGLVINVEGDKNMINTFGDSSTVNISIINE